MAGEPTYQASGVLVVASVPRSVAQIRRFAVAKCVESGYGGACDTMALLVSEVATNALVHGAGEVRVAVSEGDGALRVEVADDGPGRPVLQEFGPDAEGGRGMALVAALADAWGVQERPGGKTVWFEVRRTA